MFDAAQATLQPTFYCSSLAGLSRRTPTLERRLRSIVDLNFDGHEPPSASLVTYQLGPMTVASLTTDAIEFVRDEDVIERGQFDEYLLVALLVCGELRGTFDDRATVLTRGDICAIDLSKTTRLQTGGCKLLSTLFRRDALYDGEVGLHGRVLQSGGLRCRMLTEHMERLSEQPSKSAPPSDDMLINTTIAVMRHCWQVTQTSVGIPQPWLDELRNRILTYIDDNLYKTDLDATRIRRSFRISRAHLYRLFPGYGGILRYIRTRRLDSAFHALCSDPGQRIARIAADAGFTSERQFQRAFLSRFEMTPSELRKKHRLEPSIKNFTKPN